MENVVTYVIGLKDNLSSGVSQATEKVRGMESALGSMKSMAGTIGSVLGISFAVFKGISFVKDGVEKFHELEQVTAKVEANLRSTGGVAGMGMKELQGFAKELSSKIQASRVEIVDMQSQMLTFPAISKDNFQQSMGLIADIAKQTGHGLSETAIMYGKALSSPMDGLAKMMRYGVMFTEAEKQKITKLQESGKLVEAQKAMMESIAHSGYAGVAEAMFNADPLAKFNKTMGSLKMIVGEVAVDFLNVLMPALMAIAELFKWAFTKAKEFIEILKTHKQIIKDVSIVVASAGVAYLIMTANVWGAQVAYWALGIALNAYSAYQAIATTATYLFSAALWSTGIPEVILAVSALVAGVIALTHHFGGFGNALKGTWDIIKAFASASIGAFAGFGKAVLGALTFNPALIKEGVAQTLNAVKTGAQEIQAVWNNSDAQKASAEAKKSKEKSKLPTKGANAGVVVSSDAPMPKTKAEGAKNINIKIEYNAPLIKGFTISTTNVKQGINSLKEEISAVLTGATHDALLVADY